MIDLQRCKYQLQETLTDSPALQYDLSTLTRTAFDIHKAVCLDLFGGSAQVQLFLHNPKKILPPTHTRNHQEPTNAIEHDVADPILDDQNTHKSDTSDSAE